MFDHREGGVHDTITMCFSRVLSTVTEAGGSGGGGTVGEMNICLCHLIHVDERCTANEVYCDVMINT